MTRVTPFLVGLLFGLGLCLSGMTNAAKVLGFLDLAGPGTLRSPSSWAAPIVVAFFAFRLAASARPNARRANRSICRRRRRSTAA